VTSKHVRFLEAAKTVDEIYDSGKTDKSEDNKSKDETKQKNEYTTKVVHMSEVPG